MSKFSEGTRVICIEKNEIRKGIVKANYAELNIVVVDFDDGATEKVPLEMLAIEPEPVKAEETAQEETVRKPIEKSEITITPDEFRKIASTQSVELCKEYGYELLFTAGILCARLHTALFIETSEND